MKKVFMYIGSRRGKNSRTLQFVNGVMDRIYQFLGEGEIQADIYTADTVNINFCQGCINCFLTGKCIQDDNDDMKKIKDKLLKADIIILASPVYAHHVSADMKLFIDRISYWSHLLKLSGKVGIAVATSGGNGLEFTYNYLYKIMSYLGIKVIGKFGIDAYSLNEQYYTFQEECSKIMLEYINNKKLESDNILESVFKATKAVIESAKEYKTAEFEYWEKTGMLKCNSFEEVLRLQPAVN